MNALTTFDPSKGVPAHIAAAFGDEGNIESRQTVPSLTYEGKVWTVSINGEKTKMMRRNPDGDMEPVQVMKVIILDYAKRRGRTYYPGNYDPNKIAAPECWSDDGVAPHASVAEPKAKACQTCPMAAKGSKVVDGKPMVACAQHRMLALVPAQKPDMEPLRLKIAITSDFDKQSPEATQQGWFAFSNYMDYLKAMNVNHSAQVVTKIKFDQNAQYPKLFFAAERYLEPNEVALVAPVTKSDTVKQLLSGTWSPNGVDGTKLAAPEPEPQPTLPPIGAASDDDAGDLVMVSDDEVVVIPAAQTEVLAAEPKPAKTKPAKAEPVVEATATVTVTGALPEGLSDLLEEWGDD